MTAVYLAMGGCVGFIVACLIFVKLDSKRPQTEWEKWADELDRELEQKGL